MSTIPEEDQVSKCIHRTGCFKPMERSMMLPDLEISPSFLDKFYLRSVSCTFVYI